MENCQPFNYKCCGLKASTTKLIAKVKDMLSADLEGVTTQTNPEAKMLLAETTLAHLKHKKDQVLELDNAIGAKINVAQEFEEEIANADTYQTNPNKHITFLSEFIHKASVLPTEPQLPSPTNTTSASILPPST